MDPPPLPSTSTTIDAATAAEPYVNSLPPMLNAKLRLLCSYGGHIVPRPHSRHLSYAGGDTRIVAVDRRTTASSLSALTSHLSRTLCNNRPFVLKYQLPNEDLDSLISVTNDEDFQNMLDEHDRIMGSPTPSRIRLFLFPTNSAFTGSVLLDPKAESWFCDVLKNTGIMESGQSADVIMSNGLIGADYLGPSDSSVEAQGESLSNSGEAKHGLELGSVPESMALETSSSFGSTNSSISMTNLPSVGVHGEDVALYSLDKKGRVPSSASIESDNNSIGIAVSHPQTVMHQEPRFLVASGVYSSTVQPVSNFSDPSTVIQVQKPVQISGYQLSYQSVQNQRRQDTQYTQRGVQYLHQYSAGPLPAPSYYPMYNPQLHQQLHSFPQPNQPYPIYLVPVRPVQSYNTSMQCSLIDAANISSAPTPFHPQTKMAAPPLIAAPLLATESAENNYRTAPAATSLVPASSNQNQSQFVNLPEIRHPAPTFAAASKTGVNYETEFDDDLARAQIYKTQPSAPALPSQYQTMTKAAAELLSEVSMQVQNTIKQQIEASRPQ